MYVVGGDGEGEIDVVVRQAGRRSLGRQVVGAWRTLVDKIDGAEAVRKVQHVDCRLYARQRGHHYQQFTIVLNLLVSNLPLSNYLFTGLAILSQTDCCRLP